MKKIILIITALFFSLTSYSQTPEKFTYQSIVRSSDGSVLKSAAIGVRLSILKSSKNGITVYSETHSGSTNKNGLITLIIGDGASTDTFSAIDWSTGEYFLRVQVDPAGGIDYSIEQTSQLLSVPYALYAGRTSGINLSDDVKGVLPVSKGGTGSSTSPMIGVVTAATAADARQVLGIFDRPESAGNLVLSTVAENYLTIKDIPYAGGLQEITAGKIPISLGGTGSTTAPMVGVITAADAAAAREVLGIDGTGNDNSTPVTLASVTGNYLTLSGQEITVGKVPISLGGTGAITKSAARDSLGLGSISTQAKDAIDIDGGAIEGTTINNLSFPTFDGEIGYVLKTDGSSNLIWSAMDAAGTDNSTAVTLATVAENYLTLSGQEITVGKVPISLGGTGAITKSAARDSLGLGSISTQSKDAVDIDGGAIDGTAIGATTASTGAFSTISLGSTAITSTGAEINVLDGDTSATATTVVAGDRVILNDNGTMKQVAIPDIGTYLTSTLSLNSLTDAMYGGTNFSNSLLIGHLAHGELNEAENNLGVGKGAVAYLTSGDNNVGIGLEAGYALTEGLDNVLLGYKAGDAITTGDDNIIIGSDAAASAVGGTNQIVIGKGATGIADNTVTLGNGSITNWVPSDNNEVDLGSTTKNLKDAHLNGEIRFYEDTGNGSNYIGFKSASTLSADKIWVLPSADGSSGEVLTTNGSGTLSWVADSSGASALNNLSDVLIEATSSMYIGNDPESTTDGANYNLGIGVTTLDAITTGDGNIAVGHDALTANTTGEKNLAIGKGALDAADTESNNIAIGYDALGGAVAGGEFNVAIGNNALDALTSGDSNIAVGHDALTAHTTGHRNLAIGIGALDAADTENDNIAIGYDALGGAVAEGEFNVAIGNYSLDALTAGDYNVAVGDNTLSANTTGSYNTATGSWALNKNLGGNLNTAIGEEALEANESGDWNTAIGSQTLEANVSGDGNTAIGSEALQANTASYNTAIGSWALEANTSGSGNTAIGSESLKVSTGNYNTAIGNEAGEATTTGDNNVFVGSDAGDSNTTGEKNIIIGSGSDVGAADGLSPITNRIVIGYGALGQGDNSVTLGNTSNQSVFISSTVSTKPLVELKNTTNDANSGILKFAKDKGAAGAANDVAGLIQFVADDASQDQVMFSEIKSQVKVATNGQEGGKLTLSVAENDGTSTAGLIIEDGDADGELDVTIAAGTASLTAVAGTLSVGGTFTIPRASGSSGQVLKWPSSGSVLEWGAAGGASSIDGLSDGKSGGTDFTGSMILGHQNTGTLDAAQYNTAVGINALDAITTGDKNIAVGYDVLTTNDSGNSNTAIGYEALKLNVSGDSNTAIGYEALESNTSHGNTAIGKSALLQNTGGGGNTAIGQSALALNTGGDYNVAIGGNALLNNTADRQTAIGTYALYSNTGGSANTAIGYGALLDNTTGNRNTAIGQSAYDDADDEDDNLAIGYDALGGTNAGGEKNIAIGNYSLDAALTGDGDNNVAIGYQSLSANTSGDQNVAIGNQSLSDNTDGERNTAVGDGAMFLNQTGVRSAAFGYVSGKSGDQNASFGAYSLTAVTGNNNTAVGYYAGAAGGGNTAITSGTNNVILGHEAGVDDAAAANRIVIGQGVRGLDDNTVTLGNGSITNWLPTDDDEVSLGSSSKEMDNIYVDGIAFLDAIDFGGTALTLPGSVGSDGQVLVKAVGSNTLAWTSTDGGTTLAGLGVSATAAELNIMDGNNLAASTTIVDADRMVLNDDGTMKQVAVTDLKTYVGGVPSTILTPGMIDLESYGAGSGYSKIKKGGWNRPAIQLDEGAVSQIGVNIPVPSAYTPDGSQIEIKILYSTDTNSGNVIGYLSSARTAIGENAEDGTSSGSSPFHSTAASGTANYLTESTGNNITVATGTKMIHIMFGRNGTSGSDSCTGNMHIYGIEVIW